MYKFYIVIKWFRLIFVKSKARWHGLSYLIKCNGEIYARNARKGINLNEAYVAGSHNIQCELSMNSGKMPKRVETNYVLVLCISLSICIK